MIDDFRYLNCFDWLRLRSTNTHLIPNENKGLSVIPVEEIEACRWIVTGRVQGVGFRPFVFSLAKRFGLAGRVQNLSG